MNVLNPISRIMSTDLKVLSPEDSMKKAQDIFETHKVHHIPVVGFKKILGIISKSDFLYFIRHVEKGSGDELIQRTLLNAWKVEDVMTKEITTVQKDDTTMKALEFFARNQFHCLPVLDGEVLVGIVTPYDFIKKVIKEGLINIGYNPEPGFDFEGSGYGKVDGTN